METGLVLYKEKITRKDDFNIIQRYDSKTLDIVEERREYYEITLMSGTTYRINPDKYEELKNLLNDSSVRFIELGKNRDLIAIHQITEVKKISDRTFGRN